ncbi:NAD-binding protein [Nocardioides sp. URHA0020]|uniref:NAD-binding protein n=1 Tax=Nocardioides sp. URHA0020 TaxID=1380392 RepID=UPI00048B1A0E|nr:NAD-binding protein [Nocardioides sp. URHA0020]
MIAFLRSPRGRWYVLAALWVVVIILGIGGFIEQGRESGEPRSFLDTLYLTLQLATLDYSGSSGDMNWRLQVGRFVVPIMAASTVLITASVVFAGELNRLRIGRASGHTVVAGLGDVGKRLAIAFADAGERVVVVDADASLVAATTSADGRLQGLVGDPTDPGTLARVRVDRARRLVVAGPEDARNVRAASAAATVAVGPGRGRPALRCAVQLTDAELASLMRATDLDSAGAMRLSYFSLHERAARSLLSENPPFTGVDDHALVIGLGRFGRSLVVALGQQWAHQHPGRRTPITLVDPHASGRWAELTQRHPALVEVFDPELIDVDLGWPSADGVHALSTLLAERPPTWVAVVVDDEPLALANAVFLQQRLPARRVPVVVRMGSAAGLGTLLASVGGGAARAFPGVSVFPFLDRTCTVESVDGGIREQLAESVHEDYLAGLPDGGTGAGLQRPWGDLGDDERDLSRRRVDGIVGDLAALGCELAPLRRWGAPTVDLTDEETALLAGREHQRWYDDRTASGWTYAAARDDSARTNPLLVPWADLAPEVRQSNLDAARALQPMLARAGFEIARAA